ncbi:hypothetical protein [Mycobacterium deserti]|uniref:Uncharacterized protein n=1 Tax=Mycobacterium deserti TaxID=2978347 RepID=A0ABT2MB13_9MYCO|nr:hypothetical protein [Mycobacterium deserti]MCT7659458.1 hypothetical protein [Mycobacterium deserti]
MAATGTSNRLFDAVALGCALAIIAACGTPQTADAPAATSAPHSAAAAPSVRSVIDPRYMSLGAPDWDWKVLSHHITHDRQVFDLQPPEETFTFPNKCRGCNHPAATARLTVYAQGGYDPAAVVTGQEVTVDAGEGYYLPPRWPAGAVLAWEYDKNAWATAQGRSQTAAELGLLQELATQLRPAERIPIRFPASLSTLPADMPLSWAGNQLRIDDTQLSFDGCGQGPFDVPVAACSEPSDKLSMRLNRANEFSSHKVTERGRQEVYTVPVQIGGKEGFINEGRSTEAAIKAAPGVIVVFDYTGPADRFAEVLKNVVWAPDLIDEATWPAVADWVKQQ